MKNGHVKKLRIPINIGDKAKVDCSNKLYHYLSFTVFKDIHPKICFNIIKSSKSTLGLHPVIIELLVFKTDSSYYREDWFKDHSEALQNVFGTETRNFVNRY